jgi:hypothetical protein
MNFPAKAIFAATLAIAGLGATIENSSAMSPVRVAPAASALVQDVRWGCGPGWHPNPWGRCVPERRPAYVDSYRPRYWTQPSYRPHSWAQPSYRPRYSDQPSYQPDRWDRY